MYIFTTDSQVQDLFINGTQAGSMCINDTIMQYAGKEIPISWWKIYWYLILTGSSCLVFFSGSYFISAMQTLCR